MILPGNVPVVELAIGDDGDTLAALQTCYMRGWIEPMYDEPIPVGKLSPSTPLELPLRGQARVQYRLTDSGWAAINRSHEWSLLAVILTLAGVIIALVLG